MWNANDSCDIVSWMPSAVFDANTQKTGACSQNQVFIWIGGGEKAEVQKSVVFAAASSSRFDSFDAAYVLKMFEKDTSSK